MDNGTGDGERWGVTDREAASAEVAARLREVRFALDRHDWEAADATLQSLLAHHADEWEAHHLQGILQAKRQDWFGAEAAFRRAHQLNPAHPAPLTNLANIMTERGQYDDAIRLYHEALRLDPDYANAHHNLGVAYRRLGRLDEAVRHLKRAQCLELPRLGPIPGGTRTRAPSWVLALIAIAFALALLWSGR